jgi:DNA (cytosine-5)-methyltransferase 1
MRMVSKHEATLLMGFPANYILPADHKSALRMLGNAVCPPVARTLIEAVKAAA